VGLKLMYFVYFPKKGCKQGLQLLYFVYFPVALKKVLMSLTCNFDAARRRIYSYMTGCM
jgi:hypothetical protein